MVDKGKLQFKDLQESFNDIDSKDPLAKFIEELENTKFLVKYEGGITKITIQTV